VTGSAAESAGRSQVVPRRDDFFTVDPRHAISRAASDRLGPASSAGKGRRPDWASEPGATGCPECGYAYPEPVATRPTEYHWYCSNCRMLFVSKPTSPVRP
jgi:hypothetical protein